jgi:beta-glucosidase-like glycosyl hydrolase
VDTVFNRLSRQQRVAQLFVAGTPADHLDDYTLGLVRAGLVGSVNLIGRSDRGVAATAQLATALQQAARVAGQVVPGLFVATDQEGGDVQVLRGPGSKLGLAGVVISDDLGNAAQVRSYSPAGRAVSFFSAGGDMVLTLKSQQVAEMRAAVLARLETDSQFASQVRVAVKRVLRAKLADGLG